MSGILTLGITPIYVSFDKSPCDCQPLHFHGHFLLAETACLGSFMVSKFLAGPKTVHVTANISNFVNVSTKLHWLEVNQ